MTPVRKWLARVVVAVTLLLSVILAIQETGSLMHLTIDRSGLTGRIAVAALVFIGVLALVDVVVNDIMPKQYVLKCARRWRHTVYMLMSLGCLSLIFVIVKSHGPSAALVQYGVVAFAALFIAIFDIRDRMNGAD